MSDSDDSDDSDGDCGDRITYTPTGGRKENGVWLRGPPRSQRYAAAFRGETGDLTIEDFGLHSVLHPLRSLG